MYAKHSNAIICLYKYLTNVFYHVTLFDKNLIIINCGCFDMVCKDRVPLNMTFTLQDDHLNITPFNIPVHVFNWYIRFLFQRIADLL